METTQVSSVEDFLRILDEEGYRVSNIFQAGIGYSLRGAFNLPGWEVYMRNLRNSRTGHGTGLTMRDALADALAQARKGEAFEFRLTRPTPPTPLSELPKGVIECGDDENLF